MVVAGGCDGGGLGASRGEISRTFGGGEVGGTGSREDQAPERIGSIRESGLLIDRLEWFGLCGWLVQHADTARHSWSLWACTIDKGKIADGK